MKEHNAHGETHYQYAKRVSPPRPCHSQDINFGGGCFNCGFQPEPEDKSQAVLDYEAKMRAYDEGKKKSQGA